MGSLNCVGLIKILTTVISFSSLLCLIKEACPLCNAPIVGTKPIVFLDNLFVLDADNPLLKLDNVIATPHIGAGTKDTLDNVLSMSFRNFEDIEDGKEPKFVVNDVNVGNKVHG